MNLGNRHSQKSFAQTPQANIARSKFDRSFAVKDTMDFDFLTPIFVDEILPGDTINLNVKSFARLAPQVVPLMDNMYMDYYFFFVPNRLIWENWERFNGAQDNTSSSTDYLVPQIETPTGFVNGSIYDHMGIPTEVPNMSINALPLRAYNKIYNDWFRDQNLQNSQMTLTNDGPDTPLAYNLLRAAKPHDYFTSALPWPQKGASIQLPLGGQAPVYGPAGSAPMMWSGSTTGLPNHGGLGSPASSTAVIQEGPWSTNNAAMTAIKTGTEQDYIDNPGVYTPPYADLSEATAATINQFRQAIMMQSLLELDARGGTRYVEILKAHFNVISPDFRLQRAEYLSGGRVQIQQHVVAQTSETQTTPQGNLAAFSTAVSSGNSIGFTKAFVEHGYVLGLVRARADVTYQQGLAKMWTRQTRWDFFWPKLQELGEQAVLNKEIYAQGSAVVDGQGDIIDDLVFGYQERYAEYRYRPSEIRGQFRSNYTESLDVWHLAGYFTTLPVLNQAFIQQNTPIERSLIMQTENYPHLLYDAWFDYKHARPIMTYAVPATLGRF